MHVGYNEMCNKLGKALYLMAGYDHLVTNKTVWHRRSKFLNCHLFVMFILIPSSHLCRGLPGGLCRSRSPAAVLYPDGPLYHQSTRPSHLSPVVADIPSLSLVDSGADKSLARPGRKQATATEGFDVHIPCLLS